MTHTITAHIVVRDAARAAAWYADALGAEERGRIEVPGGKLMQVELVFGDSTVMLADEFAELGVLSPLSIGGTATVLHLRTEDVDVLWDRATGAGAEVLQPLADAFWGERYGQVEDPFGHRWGLPSTCATSRRRRSRAPPRCCSAVSSGGLVAARLLAPGPGAREVAHHGVALAAHAREVGADPGQLGLHRDELGRGGRADRLFRGRLLHRSHVTPRRARRKETRRAIAQSAQQTTERLLRDEVEGVDVARSYDGEVASVERGDRGFSESFGGGDHTGVDGSEPEVGVGVDQVGHASEIVGLHGMELEQGAAQLAQKAGLGGRPEELADEVAGFDQDKLRYDHRLGRRLEESAQR